MRTAVGALALLVFGACNSAPVREHETGEVQAILRSQVAAWNRGDLEGFMSAGYWNSPELTFYSGGSVSKGYDAMLAHYKQGYQSQGAEMGQLEFSAIEIQPLGEYAQLARGHWKLSYGAKPAVGGLFSLVLERLPEGWRIVHDHTSVEAPPK